MVPRYLSLLDIYVVGAEVRSAMFPALVITLKDVLND